jgi:hypothetical protein
MFLVAGGWGAENVLTNLSLRCLKQFLLIALGYSEEEYLQDLYELLQSRNTGKNSINQYKSILYCFGPHWTINTCTSCYDYLGQCITCHLSSYANFYKIIESY